MSLKHSIVIVDDDVDDREIIRDAFKVNFAAENYVVLDNGDQLLDYLEASNQSPPPSLILLDLNMPGRDGRETLRALKTDERYRHIPAIVFTTSSSLRDKQTVYGIGANCFISKPDTYNKLVETMAAIGKLWLH